MKDEIKKAIDNLNGVVKGIYRMDEAGLEIEDIKAVLDYITNLQESEAYYYGQYKDYKLKNEKAIEYIKSPRWKIDTHIEFNKQHLLNILQGSDKDE